MNKPKRHITIIEILMASSLVAVLLSLGIVVAHTL